MANTCHRQGSIHFHTHRLYQLNTALSPFDFMVLFRQPLPINQSWHVRGNPFVTLSKSSQGTSVLAVGILYSYINCSRPSRSFCLLPPSSHTSPTCSFTSWVSLLIPLFGLGNQAQEGMSLEIPQDAAPGNYLQTLSCKPSPDTRGSAGPPSSLLLQGEGVRR